MPARFFAHFDMQPAVPEHPQAAWRPAADVYRCQHAWLVKVDLAGVRAEDVHVEAHRSGVSISGTRRDLRLFETQEAHLMEIASYLWTRSNRR